MNWNKILLLALIFATIVFAALYFYVEQREKSMQTTTTPTPAVVARPTPTANVLLCDIPKAGNPLVLNTRDINPNIRQIDYKGHLNEVKFIKERKSAVLSMTSDNGLQTALFEVPENEPVYGEKDTELKLTDLKNLDNLTLFYNCRPNEKDTTPFLSRISLMYPRP